MSPIVDEVRLGGAALPDNGQHYGYVHFEALFSALPPVETFDPNIAWLFSPRPLVGAKVSLQGKTNQVFAGIAWHLPVPAPFFVEVSFGGLMHDQELFRAYPDRPGPLSTRLMFRESIAVGYQIDRRWRILAFADHGSNGGLGYRNIGVNSYGLMLAAALGHSAKVPRPVAPISTFDWQGPYAGFSAGVARGKYDFVLHHPVGALELSSVESESLVVGGQAGYNWLAGVLLVGIEADLSVQATTASTARLGGLIADEFVSASTNWLATTRARVGTIIAPPYLLDQFLIYATGGAAFARIARSYCQTAINTCYIHGDVAGGWATVASVKTGMDGWGRRRATACSRRLCQVRIPLRWFRHTRWGKRIVRARFCRARVPGRRQLQIFRPLSRRNQNFALAAAAHARHRCDWSGVGDRSRDGRVVVHSA